MKKNKIEKLNIFHIIFLLMIFCSFSILAKRGLDVLTSNLSGEDNPIVVIDAGHGGSDPGKVGINGSLEKEINLDIAKKLEENLVKSGITVVMTRTNDDGLYSANDNNKKSADMRKRVEIIKDANPTIVVSIHQNSFEDESCKGAQVFYHSSSTEGKELALCIQSQIKADISPENHREPKGNTSYYILKNTPCPTVIVECGFLSNSGEAKLLSDETYRDNMAKSIYSAILKYINKDFSNSIY